MRLLVSVADAGDARAAVEGGADIIDAKDPSRGGLGAVSPDTLRGICSIVGSRRLISAALGDAVGEQQIEQDARAASADGIAFVKVGFRQVTSSARVRALTAAAVRGARQGGEAGVIAVAYADACRAASLAPGAMPDIAAHAGAAGVLLDTAFKDRGGLFTWLRPDVVGVWVEAAHAASLRTAVAGQLDATALVTARELGAEIVGVRGAACEGGRNGRVSAARVAALAALVSRAAEHDGVQTPDFGRREDDYARSAR